jgi:uncharacterized protein
VEGIDPAVGFLRHALATLAYRATKFLRGAPSDFGSLRIGPSTRTPVEILAHIGDLLDWSLSLAAGQRVWKKSTPQSWEAEVDRFFDTLSRLDQRLAGAGLACSAEKLFQGPVADALTHVGQIAMLRRLAGAPVAAENYFEADIVVSEPRPGIGGAMSQAGPATESVRARALVTGASAGIGKAFAERLARDGYELILVARRRDRLEALSARLREESSVSVDVLAADLTKSDELGNVESRIAREPALDLLVNNAGFGGYMPFVELAPARAEELVRLQVLAVTLLTRAALPGMIARKKGAIINVSSRLAFSASLPSPPLPKRAVYAATKSYINTFSRIVANELGGTGVRVQALCPGVVRTEFHEVQGMDASRFPVGIMSPEDLVAASLAGLERNEVICIPALDDPGLLAAVDESERHLLQESSGGEPSKRYER